MEYLGSKGFRDVNLDDVTSATNGASVDVMKYEKLSVFINVSGNSGAVTVTIETSPDGTNWYELDQKVYTATNAKDIYSYVDVLRYIRTTTATHSSSTVKTTIIGRY